MRGRIARGALRLPPAELSSLTRVGNLPFALQGKLLAVLQNREVIRLGSNKSIPFDVRLISASNMPLREMVAEKKFRQDLLYRINTVEVQVPPSARAAGETRLSSSIIFLPSMAANITNPTSRSRQERLKRLEEYDWPGNVARAAARRRARGHYERGCCTSIPGFLPDGRASERLKQAELVG